MSAPLRLLSIESDSQSGRDLWLEERLGALWRGKGTIAAWLCAALVVSVIAQILIPPSYTGEAIVRFNFDSEETSGAGAKGQTTAMLDPSALVEGAARIMRSRAVASAAVNRLGLDRDPRFTRQSTLAGLFSSARSALGLQVAGSASPQELATAKLLSQIAVTNEPRSYLITINATAENPQRAADLANAVVFEYLRSEIIEGLKEAQGVAERDLDELRSTYGKLHPNYLRGQERVAQLRAKLEAVRNDGDLAASLDSQFGPSFIPADVVATPSSPNPRTVIGLGALAGLAVGVWLSVRRARASADEVLDNPGAEPAGLRGSRGSRGP